MSEFFVNPSIILDIDLLDENQRKKILALGYIKTTCFYGSQYNSLPVYCWIKEIDKDIDIAEWEHENLPFSFEEQRI